MRLQDTFREDHTRMLRECSKLFRLIPLTVLEKQHGCKRKVHCEREQGMK